MFRKFARLPVSDVRFAGSMRVRFCILASIAALACAPQQAEVGADPPFDAGLDPRDGVPPFAEASSDAQEGGAVGRCDGQAPLRLYLWNLRTAASSPDVNYIVKVENATGAPLAMSSLEVRYYLTNELMAPSVIDVFYIDTCCSNKRTDFKDGVLTSLETLSPRPNADAYLRVAFASTVGLLAAGDAVQVEIGFHDVGYTRSQRQTNDYSYVASAGGTQSEWDGCPGPQCEAKFTSCASTIYRDGVLVWGTPP
jgi:hypothetical protein